MKKLDEAIHIASEVHLGQVDKAGDPYILHVLEVMKLADKLYAGPDSEFQRDELLCIAVLHDSLEDCGFGPAGISHLESRIEEHCGGIVLSGVQRMSKVKGENYLESYIPRVSENWKTRIVKIADLTHNMDPSRLPRGEIRDYDFQRWDKYRRALVMLTESN